MANRKVFYGLHMVQGCAQYQEMPGAPTILVNEETLKKMDTTFPGCPVFVNHVDEVKEETVKHEADGYVIESFFNQADGNHWVKFIVITEQGLKAIEQGWRLSNSYVIKNKASGGRWHGLDYDAEVVGGEYEHLAIVQSPRYRESIILTPEKFKEYNFNKEQELLKLANSEEKESQMFKIFKQTKEDKTADFKDMVIQLPKSKKEIALEKLVNEADIAMVEPQMANLDHMVKIQDKDMSVKDLVNAYNEMCAKMNESGKEGVAQEKEEPGLGNEEEKKKKELENAEEMKKKELENAEKEKMEKEKKDNAEKLANAEAVARKAAADKAGNEDRVILLPRDQVALGKKRYGSGN